MHTTLKQLHGYGQSIWYDNISRSLMTGGELQRMIEQGIVGVTSNPTIFEKAITGGKDYDEQLHELLSEAPDASVGDIIRALMVRDIQMAADLLRPIYERTKGCDGYVSVEVAPKKARDTAGTIAEVQELWATVDRKNVMIKIPATVEGLPAIEEAIVEGCNVNVTLIFSVERYRDVALAYLRGLERRIAAGKPVDHIASVASVFVSRIDTLVDELLQKKMAAAMSPSATARLKGLLGKSAVANTKMIYQAFKEMFHGARFDSLTSRGAVAQRPLWASTGTKNPAYSDLLYVETLIGPSTINTVPPATYAAILDHSRPALTVESDLAGARGVLRDVAAAGITIPAVMKKLEDDGVAAFEKSFDGLYKHIEIKRRNFRAGIPA